MFLHFTQRGSTIAVLLSNVSHDSVSRLFHLALLPLLDPLRWLSDRPFGGLQNVIPAIFTM